MQNKYYLSVFLLTFTTMFTYKMVHEQIFEPYCIRCHSKNNAKNGIRLDNYENVIRNLQAIYNSMILSTPSEMPPRGYKELDKSEISMLAQWIDSGAKYE